MSAPIPLGDVKDLDAYVAATLRKIAPNASADENEEAIADGREIAWEEFRLLQPGERLSERLARVLGNHLRDRWRDRHKWHRRAEGEPDARLEDHPEIESPGSADRLTERTLVRTLIASRGALEDHAVAAKLRTALDGIPRGPSAALPPLAAREDYWDARIAEDAEVGGGEGFDFKK